MLELPNFAPLRVTRSRRALSRRALDSLDHLLVVSAKRAGSRSVELLRASTPTERVRRWCA